MWLATSDVTRWFRELPETFAGAADVDDVDAALAVAEQDDTLVVAHRTVDTTTQGRAMIHSSSPTELSTQQHKRTL